MRRVKRDDLIADRHRLRLDQYALQTGRAALTLSDHISTFTALSPRKRLETAEPRNLNIYWYLPTHLLLLGVGQVFAVLNPIVIACVVECCDDRCDVSCQRCARSDIARRLRLTLVSFNMVYFVLLLTLFKHQVRGQLRAHCTRSSIAPSSLGRSCVIVERPC